MQDPSTNKGANKCRVEIAIDSLVANAGTSGTKKRKEETPSQQTSLLLSLKDFENGSLLAEAVKEYLSPQDFRSLLVSCKSVSQHLQTHDSIHESFAKRMYRSNLLDVSKYNGSWKDLVEDFNGLNVVYIRFKESLGAIYLDPVGLLGSSFAILWDRKYQKLALIMLAEGPSIVDICPEGTMIVGEVGKHILSELHPAGSWKGYVEWDSSVLCTMPMVTEEEFGPIGERVFSFNPSRDGRPDYETGADMPWLEFFHGEKSHMISREFMEDLHSPGN